MDLRGSSSTRCRSAVLIAAVCAAAPAAAQRPDSSRADPDTARLPAVHVVGSLLDGGGPSVGSGVPARVAVIGESGLSRNAGASVTRLLAREPGVTLYDDLGSGAKLTIVARGFTASPVVGLPQGLSVFLDGVPLNEPDAGQVNFDLLPMDHLQRVEVLSGTASLLGPNSLGGAVNLVSAFGESATALELSAGSFGSYGTRLSRGGAIADWSYYAGGSYASDAGWRQLTDASRLHGVVSVGRERRDAGVRLLVLGARSRAETAGSLPLSVYGVRPDSNLSAGDFEDMTQLHVALTAFGAVGAGRSSASLYLRANQAERFNVNQVDDPDVRSFSRNATLGAQLDWRATRRVGSGAVEFRTGAGGSANRSRIRIHAERIDPRLTTHVESPIGKLDLYSVVDYSAGPVTLSGGARYDLVRVPFRNRLNPARDTTSLFDHVSPRAGVNVALGRGASWYASAGRSFRAPALIELACADPNEPCPLPFALGDDPPLAPVTATTLETGVRWLPRTYSLFASAFRTNVRDDIFLLPYEDASEPAGSTIDGYFANIADTRREGVELGASGMAGTVSVFANYARTLATFRTGGFELFSIREATGEENDVEIGDRLPLVPEHSASLGASMPVTRVLDLTVEASYTGERVLRGDEGNDEPPLPGYWVTDLGLAARARGWTFQLQVANVTNSRHATFGTFNINQGGGDVLERFLTPGAPRSFRVLLRRD